MRRLAVALALLASPAARAMPVDRVLELNHGDLHFEKAQFVLEAEVQPPELATVELLPAGELLVTPLKAGEGLLFLYKQGQVEGVRLRIDHPPSIESAGIPKLEDARRACPAAESREFEGERFVLATVDGEPCRQALKQALASDVVYADHLRLSFSVAGLQTQLRAFNAVLKAAGIAGVTAAYTGATLTLKGSADPATHRKLLSLLWSEALGRLDLDDQIDVTLPPKPAHAP